MARESVPILSPNGGLLYFTPAGRRAQDLLFDTRVGDGFDPDIHENLIGALRAWGYIE